jgi:two-component system cell cycle sensor histidine kinase/response regulator CckA
MDETVLVVDDSATVRKLACAFVEDAGYRVLEASCHAEAVDKACQCGSVDAVVADIVMPDGSGFELVRKLRRIHPAMRVLYMSAYHEAHLANDFIAKPFSAADLRDALRVLLEGDDDREQTSPLFHLGRPPGLTYTASPPNSRSEHDGQ